MPATDDASTTSANTGTGMAADAPAPDAQVRVSVVLPACGRMDLLDRCLDALMRQHLDPGSYDVFDDFHPEAKATLVAKDPVAK